LDVANLIAGAATLDTPESRKIGAIRMRPASAGIALFASEDAEAVGASRKSEFRAVVMMKSPVFEV
jgi:hypothetical protein